MGKIVWLLAAAAVVGLAGGGSLGPMSLSTEGLLHRVTRSTPVFPTGLTEDQIFQELFTPIDYLLKPEDFDDFHPPPPEDVQTRSELQEIEDEDSEEEQGRSLGSGAKFLIKQIGKVGLNLLKKGLKFLKSAFYKLGGKRLLKRAKKYLKEDMFTIQPLQCEGSNCTSCATFALPFNIKKFKACAEMGVKREKNLETGYMTTNFTVGFKVVGKSLFNREFEVGDIANCFEFGSDPEGEPGMASIIGKVCVQGFEFTIDSDKTGKFCLAVVFKRWATGIRFCAQRLKRDPPKEGKNDENTDKENDESKDKPKCKTTPEKECSSKGKVTDSKKRKWKVELKRISAGEQDAQIVSDTPLFKNEAQVREEQSKQILEQGIQSKP